MKNFLEMSSTMQKITVDYESEQVQNVHCRESILSKSTLDVLLQIEEKIKTKRMKQESKDHQPETKNLSKTGHLLANIKLQKRVAELEEEVRQLRGKNEPPMKTRNSLFGRLIRNTKK